MATPHDTTAMLKTSVAVFVVTLPGNWAAATYAGLLPADQFRAALILSSSFSTLVLLWQAALRIQAEAELQQDLRVADLQYELKLASICPQILEIQVSKQTIERRELDPATDTALRTLYFRVVRPGVTCSQAQTGLSRRMYRLGLDWLLKGQLGEWRAVQVPQQGFIILPRGKRVLQAMYDRAAHPPPLTHNRR